MGIFGKLSAAIAPVTALKRARARVQLDAIRAYEAAKPSRTRATKRETRSADNAVFAAGVSLREQARWLDENHDLITCLLICVLCWSDLFANPLLIKSNLPF